MSPDVISEPSNGILDRVVKFFVENQDERTKEWFLSGSITPLIMILVTYLYFCLYAGPRYMAKRKPFKLEGVLIAYNAVQVLLSIVLVYEGIEGGWRKHYNYSCQPVDYSRNPVAMRMARAVWMYYMCKVVELLDTVFFVLRKKQNQVSFLHVYHHTLMPVCGFIGVKYFAGGHGTLLGVINSFIHVCMYAYYMLAAMGPKVQKYLWWKRYLTVMQIVIHHCVLPHGAGAVPADLRLPEIDRRPADAERRPVHLHVQLVLRALVHPQVERCGTAAHRRQGGRGKQQPVGMQTKGRRRGEHAASRRG
ncbi:elongation of very long chain fatty acids protein 7 isoform X2 [Anopheles gambiae]|uniref:elongation of very long chain fatty acids protein 7 isoform X2 n=1 Tax=Anopheles gambiae TaxID=7165 RepID=UPI002AC978AE|nr:elongation of very long chain fatty acids protein 7 isoform X2 [Anopheles gambiae]